jgi:hypothetical protein
LFFPGIQKAILMLHGEQGSAKTTLQELIKTLVDPSSILTLAFPRDINEFIQGLAHNYIVYFDNISNIPEWISDILCRAVTGSGFSKRMLFSDDDDIIYNFKRCIGFNGINLAATKADLLDRGLIIQLSKISKDKRRENEEIRTEFEIIRPKLLGYIFSILVKVLATISSVKLSELPRMADFAKVCETISRWMGNEPNVFIKAYERNIQLQTEQVLESNIIALVIVKFMDNKEEWIGSATALLSNMETVAATMKVNTKSRAWPKGPNILIRRLPLIDLSGNLTSRACGVLIIATIKQALVNGRDNKLNLLVKFCIQLTQLTQLTSLNVLSLLLLLLLLIPNDEGNLQQRQGLGSDRSERSVVSTVVSIVTATAVHNMCPKD